MDPIYKYRTVARWTSSQTGLVESDSAADVVHFCAPPEFGGLERRWTPEDLLLAALATCFTITFRGIAARSKFEYIDFHVEVEGTVKKGESGYAFSAIVFRPMLSIHNEEKRDRALNLLLKAKNGCLVSKALALAPTLEPHVEVGNVASVG